MALALVIVFAAALFGGGANPSEVSDSVTAVDFRLTLQSPKDRYAAQEPIDIVATLEYLGDEPSIEVSSHPGMPGFGVEALDGSHRVANPGYRMSCVRYQFRRGEPVTFPFAKSGGLVPGAADFEFMREYLNVTDGRPDPVLRLPAGRWRIFAIADFAVGDCGPNHYDLEAEVTVVVGAPDQNAEASESALPTASPTTRPSPSPSVAPSPTMPPPHVAVPYPDGCAAYRLSDRRCAYIVDWAKKEAGIGAGDPVSVELLGDHACPSDDTVPCGVMRTMAFIVRVRLTTQSGESSDHPVFCGLGGEMTLLCTERPRIWISTPMNGYTDVPCQTENGPCATPLPTIDPAAAAAAEPLSVPSLDIVIDHIGAYSIPVGEAVLPNGILSEAAFGLADDMPSSVLLNPGFMYLEVTSLEGGPPFDNYYRRGWHDGTERVQVTLTFTVEWMEADTVLEVTGIRVH